LRFAVIVTVKRQFLIYILFMNIIFSLNITDACSELPPSTIVRGVPTALLTEACIAQWNTVQTVQ